MATIHAQESRDSQQDILDPAEPDNVFAIAIALSLWIRDPLFTAKDAIANTPMIFYVSTATTYLTLEAEIKNSIEAEKSQAWKFVDWTRYSIMPVEIRSRSFQHGGNRPIEKLIITDTDLKDTLSIIEYAQGGDHLAAMISIYEGDHPPAEDSPGMQDEGIEISAYQNSECEVCGFEHGVGECRLANGGIRVEAYGDENGGWDDGGGNEATGSRGGAGVEEDGNEDNWGAVAEVDEESMN